MSSFNANSLNPKKDHDALFVLMISFLILILSMGLLYLYYLFQVIDKARSTLVSTQCSSAIFLIFGKKLAKDRPDLEYRCRLQRLVNCEFKTAILMGGRTGSSSLSEAQAGLDYLSAYSLKDKIIHLEQSSTNTLENLKNIRLFLVTQNTVIISNRYHLARCSVLAASLGIAHQLCAAENHFNYSLTNLVKCMAEAFYLHWFYCGKYWAIITKNQRMLGKIS